jgi:ATP-dependent Clp protease ATP-binding subunit ClpA
MGCSSPGKFTAMRMLAADGGGCWCCLLQVSVDPPNIEAVTSILRGLRPRYEHHHGVTITESALLASAKLSSRYISGRHLPDKAIDCLDEAAAQVSHKSPLPPPFHAPPP